MARILSKEMVVQDRPLLAVNGVLILTNGRKKYMAFTGGKPCFHPEDGAIVIWPADFRLKLGPCASDERLDRLSRKQGWMDLSPILGGGFQK